MTSGDSKIEKVQTNFKALTTVASSLNTASNELTKTVALLDEAVKKLNIGLTVWVTFRFGVVEPPEYDVDQIGYTKVNGTWGIALRQVWGDAEAQQRDENGPWLFNDAPRELRLQSVDKIPDVIEALGKEAFNTTQTIEGKTKELRELAEAIGPLTNDSEKVKTGRFQMGIGNTARISDLAGGPKQGGK